MLRLEREWSLRHGVQRPARRHADMSLEWTEPSQQEAGPEGDAGLHHGALTPWHLEGERPGEWPARRLRGTRWRPIEPQPAGADRRAGPEGARERYRHATPRVDLRARRGHVDRCLEHDPALSKLRLERSRATGNDAIDARVHDEAVCFDLRTLALSDFEPLVESVAQSASDDDEDTLPDEVE